MLLGLSPIVATATLTPVDAPRHLLTIFDKDGKPAQEEKSLTCTHDFWSSDSSSFALDVNIFSWECRFFSSVGVAIEHLQLSMLKKIK